MNANRILLILCLLLIAIIYLFTDRIPPAYDTKTTMSVLQHRRLPQYVRTHRRLPDSLQELPPLPPEYDSSIEDGWGREIIYRKFDDGTVELLSYGKDGKLGGMGDNQDILVKFQIDPKSGKLREDDP